MSDNLKTLQSIAKSMDNAVIKWAAAEIARLREERDAAIRERESWKLLADRTNERLSAAEARVAELEAASGGGEQPRGWLTEDERKALRWVCSITPIDTGKANEHFSALRALLARSSPPEVVLESWREAAGEVVSLDDVRAALAAIGVAVKEVGRE